MNSDFINRLVTRFETLEASLNKLDAATGDGDHGSTILKGLKAAAENPDEPAKAFRKAAGGASGSLFANIIGALHDVQNSKSALPDALARAADRISQMGQAKTGDKTMLDALVPASLALDATSAAEAALKGCEATRDMAAKRGRAKYVEDAGVGHIDAGATSIAEIMDEFAKMASEE